MPSLRVLFVCTGNICRSPSAEFLLRDALEQRLGDDAKQIELASAGLGTPGGWDLDPEIADLLERAQVRGTQEFRSRRIDASVLQWADLVLTGTKQHRLAIGADFPEAYSRTFSMREATALLRAAGGAALPAYDVLDRGRAVIALLQQQRGTVVLADSELDVADPHGRRTAAYEAMFREVRGIVDVLAFVFAPLSVRVRRPTD